MITPRGLFAIGALGATALFTLWVLQVSAPVETKREGPSHVPDFLFASPRITRFGPDGTLVLDLTASHAVHYPDDDTVALEDLRIDLHTQSGEDWRMAAQHGTGPMGAQEFELSGAVTVGRPQGTDAGLQLRTDRVTLRADTRTLDTQAAVTIVEGGSSVRAIGMHADLLTQRIELHHQVRSDYATP